MLGVFAGPPEMVHSKFCTRVERVEKSQLGGLIAEHSPSVITTGIYLLGVLCKEPQLLRVEEFLPKCVHIM